MRSRYGIIIALVYLPLSLSSQTLEFEQNPLWPTSNSRYTQRTEAPIPSKVSLYSDGSHLSLVIQVWDKQVRTHSDLAYSDHVEVWLALPQSAYPTDFEYAFHPNYLSAPGFTSRGNGVAPARLFSVYSEYAQGLNRGTFLDAFDYPKAQEIDAYDLKVPNPRLLQKEDVHFGLVHFGFYPHLQEVVTYNQPMLDRLATLFGLRMGKVANGVRFTTDWMDHGEGYVITVEFAPEALGFVQLPELRQLSFMVDIADTGQGGPARVVSSTAPQREPGQPFSFNRVRFRTPLYTNVTQIPDTLFHRSQYYPIFAYSEQGWQRTAVDVDPIVYQEGKSSQELMEVRFMPLNYSYEAIDFAGIPIKTLKLPMEFVNEISRVQSLTFIEDHLLKTVQSHGVLDEPSMQLGRSWFLFPDGALGLIYNESAPLHPYGWGESGKNLQGGISITRITSDRISDVVYIRQGDGPSAYCEIGPYYFEDHYVYQLDWIEEGKTLILRLKHRYLREKKRVMIQWEDDGTGVEITLL